MLSELDVLILGLGSFALGLVLGLGAGLLLALEGRRDG